jgi:hypothetical protein
MVFHDVNTFSEHILPIMLRHAVLNICRPVFKMQFQIFFLSTLYDQKYLTSFIQIFENFILCTLNVNTFSWQIIYHVRLLTFYVPMLYGI